VRYSRTPRPLHFEAPPRRAARVLLSPGLPAKQPGPWHAPWPAGPARPRPSGLQAKPASGPLAGGPGARARRHCHEARPAALAATVKRNLHWQSQAPAGGPSGCQWASRLGIDRLRLTPERLIALNSVCHRRLGQTLLRSREHVLNAKA
jgi:hypothetical protein